MITFYKNNIILENNRSVKNNNRISEVLIRVSL